MIYNDMPVIIPLLATGYLLTIYLLLILAQRTTKSSRYAADSFTDTYIPYLQTKTLPKPDELERWSLIEAPERRSANSSKAATLTLTTSPSQKVQEVSSIP
ncbi:MAG: hypothetical protein LDL41_12515 [Coleofasciculus sp. S288]|nr:hypothetical protein [Coleofasciculus sp. S288]